MNNQTEIQSEVLRQHQNWATDPIRASYTNQMLDIIQRQPIRQSPLKNAYNKVLDNLSEQLGIYLKAKYPLLYV